MSTIEPPENRVAARVERAQRPSARDTTENDFQEPFGRRVRLDMCALGCHPPSLPMSTFLTRLSPVSEASARSEPRPAGGRSRANPERDGGFTLLEIIVVIGILSILATLVITNLTKSLENSRISVSKLFVSESMKTALTTYKIQMGDYPSTEEGLNALVAAPASKADRWQGPYIDGKMPLDPWGHPYQYRYPGTKNKIGYDLWSMGPDGVDGTDDDIGNWQ
jgi:general secretion pathway protein G